MTSSWKKIARDYGVALLMVGMATVLRTVSIRALGAPVAPFAPFFTATLLAAALAGFGPGAVASVLGVVVGLRLVSPQPDVAAPTIFLAQALFISWLIDRFRRTKRQAETYASEILVRERRFHSMIEKSNDALLLIGPTGEIRYSSLAIERILGYPARQLLGTNVLDLIHPEDRAEAQRSLAALARQGGVTVNRRERWRRADGQVIWIEGSATNHLEEPSLTAIACAVRDVTEQKEVEDRIRASEERFRLLIDGARDYAILMLDPEGRVEHWTAAAERVKGFSAADVVGRHFSVFFPADVARSGHPDRVLEQATAKGRHEEEGWRVRKDGSSYWAMTVVTALRDDSGSLRGFAKVSHDLTERRRVEQELRDREEQLQLSRDAAEAANRAKTAFLANMSHEIRTPLGAMLGFAELLAETHPQTPPEDGAAWISAIHRNGLQLKGLIDEILDLSKVEAGRLDVQTATVAVAPLLADVLQVLKPAALRKGITLEIDDARVPAAVDTDAVRLRQILLNVVGNGVKFTDRGGVHVTAEGTAAELLTFTVKDTGPGISVEQQARLFQPFTQVDTSLSRRFGGSGLGLALSRRLARALGGDVEILASTIDQGTTFVVTVASGVRGRARAVTGATKEVAEPEGAPRLDGVRILLVEDAPDLQLFTKRVLSGAGATVDLASNGRVGADMALAGRYDLVLMDIQMPELDGNAATQELRRQGFTTPIVALTAHAMKEEREALALGFDDYLTKPINHRTLIRCIARFTCDASQARGAPGGTPGRGSFARTSRPEGGPLLRSGQSPEERDA